MENKETMEKVEDVKLENVSGGARGHGRVAKKGGFMNKIKNFFGFGSKDEEKKGNYMDEHGCYQITCIKCGKLLNTLHPQSGADSTCGPQVCEECKAKEIMEKTEE